MPQPTIYNIQPKQGFSLIEIILGVSIFALLGTAVVGSLIFSEQSKFIASQRQQALDIAQEGLEAARNIRDENYVSVSTGDNGLATTSGRWVFTGSSDSIDGVYTRKVLVNQIDNFRKKITASVTWDITPTRQGKVELISRLTNWKRITAGSAPTLSGLFDLTTANSGNDNANAISIAFKNPYAFMGRANSAGGSEFYVFDVTNPAVPSLLGQLALNGDPNDIVVFGNYAYVASTDNSEELQIVDVSTPSAPSLAATFDLTVANSGNNIADGLSIDYLGGTNLYYGRSNSAGQEFIVFNVSNPLLPTITSIFNLNGGPNDLKTLGNNIFIASSDNASELQVVDVTIPAVPVLLGSLDLSSGDANADGTSIALGAGKLFIGRKGSAAPELYAIDITVPALPALLGSFDFGVLDLNAIDHATSTDLVFAGGTSATADDYKSVDVSDPTAPTLITTLNLNGTPNKMVYGSAVDKVFIASSANTEELEVVAP